MFRWLSAQKWVRRLMALAIGAWVLGAAGSALAAPENVDLQYVSGLRNGNVDFGPLWYDTTFTSVVASPNGQKIYFGRTASDDQAMRNLVVLTLDSNGNIVGTPTDYVASTIPLATITSNSPAGGQENISSIALNTTNSRLYFTEASKRTTPNVLEVYSLDSAGNPTGTPRNYDGGNDVNDNWSLEGVLLHPTLPILYMSSVSMRGVNSYALNSVGEPVPVGGLPNEYDLSNNGMNHGSGCMSISADGKHMYLGTYPDVLGIVDLDPTGAPTLSTYREYTVSNAAVGTVTDYLQYVKGTNAIYMVRPDPSNANNPPILGYWTLSTTNGNPIGLAAANTGIHPALIGDAALTIGVDNTNKKLWVAQPSSFIDAFTSNTVIDGMTPTSYTISSTGAVTGTGTATTNLALYGNAATVVPTANTASPVFLNYPMVDGPAGSRTSGWQVRVTLTSAKNNNGTGAFPVPTVIQFGPGTGAPLGEVDLGSLTTNTPSAWVPLDTSGSGNLLTNLYGQLNCQVQMPAYWEENPNDPTALGNVTVQVDIKNGAGTIIKSLTENVVGYCMGFFLPGYATSNAYLGLPSGSPAGAETYSQRSQDYLNNSLLDQVVTADRPTKLLFNTSTFVSGGEGNQTLLTNLVQTCANLGLNTLASAQSYYGGLALSTINSTLTSNGLPNNSLAQYSPGDLSGQAEIQYFSYEPDMSSTNLNSWAQYYIASVTSNTGASSASLVDFILADEPGWYFPDRIDDLLATTNPTYLAAFQAWLQTQPGLTPSSFGKSSWSQVDPIKQGTGNPIGSTASLQNRTGYYWTNKFFPAADALAFEETRAAITSNLGGRSIFTGENNDQAFTMTFWYNPSPNVANGSIDPPGPDTASGHPDWMQLGRYNNTLWVEDWVSDQYASVWSSQAAMMRCATALGTTNWTTNFGGYVVGEELGNHKAGGKYKVFPILGNGGKEINNFLFGPGQMMGNTDAWSDDLYVYPELADAYRLAGRAESLIYPGKPVAGKIAILLPGISTMWDTNAGPTYYTQETMYLHDALSHAFAGPVDYVDDVAVAAGTLTTNDYYVLYVTGPNVSAAAQTKINSWATGFGTHNRTVVVMPGAGTANEYNTATTTFDTMLGLTTGKRTTMAGTFTIRTNLPFGIAAPQFFDEDPYTTSVITTNASFFYTNTTMNIRGPFQVLVKSATTTSNDAIYTGLGTGVSAAVTTKIYTSNTITNRATAYGFYPGYQYFASPDRNDWHHLPQNWSIQARELAVMPAQRTVAPRTVSISGPIGPGLTTLTTNNDYRNAVEVEALPLTSSSGVAIVLINWSDSPISSMTLNMAITGTYTHAKLASSGSSVTLGGSSGNYTATIGLTDVDVLMITP